MTDTKTSLDFLLKDFLSTDEYRPAMMQPNTIGNFTYATDGHQMIRIPNSFLEQTYPAHEKVYQAEPLFAEAHVSRGRTLEVVIPLSELKNALALVPEEVVFHPCYQCKGEMEITCDACGHTHKCKLCDGEGYTDEIMGKRLAERPFICFDNEVKIRPAHIANLVKLIEEIKAPAYWITKTDPVKPVLFSVGEIFLLISPQNITHLEGFNSATEVINVLSSQ